MKYIVSIIIAVVLFSSCTLTQRRYTSGYSVNWKHKAPKTVMNKEPVIVQNTIKPSLTTLDRKQPSAITIPAEKLMTPARVIPVELLHSKHTLSNHTISASKDPITNATTITQGDKPRFFTGDEQEDDHASKALTDGILSLGSPAAGFLILVGIVLSIGTTIGAAPGYAFGIFGAFCALGLFFAVMAIIQGFTAINEINASPDTYSGKGDAVLGIILAVLLPLGGLAAYLIFKK